MLYYRVMNALIPSSLVADNLLQWLQLAAGAYSKNTQITYRNAMGAFVKWCGTQGLCPLPALPDSVAAYLRSMNEAGKAVATIRLHCQVIGRMHKAAKLKSPCSEESVYLTLRTIARDRGTQQKQADPLTERDAVRIIARVQADGMRLKDARDVALVLVGRDLLARGSELVSITVESVAFDDEDGTATVMLLRRKTETEPIPCLLGSDAVVALTRWLALSGITSGPVFRSLTRGGRLREKALTRRDVWTILRELAERADLEHSLSTHSMRVGMAQDLAAANVEMPAIMQAGSWSSPMMVSRYIRNLSVKRGAIAQYHARKR